MIARLVAGGWVATGAALIWFLGATIRLRETHGH